MELKRISILDGFRALAILPVIGFHYFSRWTPPLWGTNLYPYGGTYSEFPLFRYGYLGVEFFFVISGFVISMTLFASKNVRDFLMKRIARLWPAMLLCSVLTFSLLKILPQTFFVMEAKNFLPSLTFVEPFVFEKLLHTPFSWIDGAYWSLSVEVRFYFWATVLYFLFRKHFLETFFAFTLAGLAITAVAYRWILPLRTVSELAFFPGFLPWFAMGVAFFHLFQGKKQKQAHLIVVASLGLQFVQSILRQATEGATVGSPVGEWAVFALIVAFFYALVYRPHWLSFFGWSFVSTLGAASYSLYLLHQNLGVALIRVIADQTSLPGELIALGVIGLLITAAISIYRFWETPAKRLILKRTARWTL